MKNLFFGEFMGIQKGDIVEVGIDRFASDGQGVGRVAMANGFEHKGDAPPLRSGVVVFVEGVVPGDVVRARIKTKKRRYMFGEVEEFVVRSKARVEARCAHFGLKGDGCGGCSLQEVSYGHQLALKEQQVRDALVRIGGFGEDVVLPIIGCEQPWFYRNKIELSFTRLEDPVKNGTLGARLGLGLHVKGRRYDVIELRECFLMADYVGSFAVKMREFFRGLDGEGLLVGDDGALVVRSLVVREGKNTGEIMVHLMMENAGEIEGVKFLESFVREVRDFFEGISGKGLKAGRRLTSVYVTMQRNIQGRPKTMVDKLLWGDAVIHEVLTVAGPPPQPPPKRGRRGLRRELKFEILPHAFFQPNPLQAQKLYELAVGFADLKGVETVFDLYCGTGTIALCVAPFAKKVVGIELNENAVLNAQKSAKMNGVTNVEFVAADVGAALEDGGIGAEAASLCSAVIVDPPRNGLMPKVVEQILEMGAKRLVYVSCNPATLARDARLLCKKEPSYHLEKVQPVDMFPHTSHIENVALFTRM